MLYRISVAERGLTGIAKIFRSRLSRLDDLLRAGTVPLNLNTHMHVSMTDVVLEFGTNPPVCKTWQGARQDVWGS